MSAQVDITSTGGVTLPDGAVPQEVTQKGKVGTSTITGETGEVTFACMLNTVENETRITGIGLAPTVHAPGAIGTPSTMTIIEAEQNENNNGRATFSCTASGVAAFTDGAGGGGGGDTDITQGTVTLISVSFAMAQSVRTTIKVNNKVVTGGDGTPKARAVVTTSGTGSVKFLGDQPAINLGTGGAALGTFSGGVTLVPEISTFQKVGDWNGGDYNLMWWPGATAG